MDRTLHDLIESYQTHKVSSFHKLRYQNRKWQAGMLARIDRLYGHFPLKDIRYVTAKEWHMDWLGPENKVAIAHALISTLRTLVGFGLTLLEDVECERLCMVLGKLKVPQCKPRTAVIVAEQAIAIRRVARDQFRYSIALAQALQFELILRQKDVIGEYVPHSEPGISDVVTDKQKWIRGLRWEEIDENLMLHHVTSKKQKMLVVDLKMAIMVLEEFDPRWWETLVIENPETKVVTVRRDLLPASGPIIISETTGMPYHAEDFRRKWRLIGDMAGVPKNVHNRDSRAGGISEARDAGADIEDVREAATHSDIKQTRDYDRLTERKIANVQSIRMGRRKIDR